MKARGLADDMFKRGNGHLSQQGNNVKLSVFRPPKKKITLLKGEITCGAVPFTHCLKPRRTSICESLQTTLAFVYTPPQPNDHSSTTEEPIFSNR